ncbi:MAG: hypothetical protein L3J78_00320, partial [Thermoplasmata archaeon]|nr:hypothetical protein [Thermoplasmata archaeon]
FALSILLLLRLVQAPYADGWITLLYVVAIGATIAMQGFPATLRMFCEGTMERLRQLGTLV